MSSRFEYPIPGRAPSLLSMVETREWPAAVQDAPEEAPAEEPARGWRVVSGMTLAGAVLGVAISLAWPQAYVATSEMLLNPAAMQAGPATSRLSLAVVENQLRLLRSGVTLNAAVDRLNLAADAEFNGEAAGPFGVAGALASFGDLVAGDGASTMEQRRRRAVERLAGAVEARQEPGSPVVSISVRTSDPEKSALIANTMSGLFLDTLAGVPTDGTNVASLREELAAAERAVADFRQKNGLPDAYEARQLARALETARDRTAALTAQVQTVNGLDTMATGSIGPASPPQPVADALARQASAKRQVESLATRLGPRHPDLLTARADLEGAAREVDLQKQRLADALQEQLQQAEREQQEFASRLAGNGAEGSQTLAALRELERTAETRRAAYEDALSASGSAAPAAGMRVLSQAEPPLEPAGPSTPMLTLGGALGGLLAGLGFTGWRRAERDDQPADEDHWDDRFEDEHHSEADWEGYEEPSAEAAYEAKETETMYPYPPHVPPSAQGPHEAHPDHRPMGYAPQHPYIQQAAPGWYPPVPHDPWAHARGYAPPAAPYYGHPAAPTVVYVPVPAQPPAAPVDHYERDRIIDRRTDAAIEEIRQSLRALREAIEDFADDRYGT